MTGSATTFAERLRAMREELGMTQTELAHRIGYSGRSAVNNWETGQRQPPMDAIEALAKALNVEPAWLAGWTNKE